MANKALNEFLTTHLDGAYRFAYAYVKDHPTAEDVVAESVEKALSKFGTLKDPGKIKPWFYQIVANNAKNALKKRSKIVYLDEFSSCASEADDYSQLHLEDLFKILSADERAIVALRFFEQHKLSEIAEILSVNENTVKTRLYSVLKKLRMELSWEECENE